MGEAKPSSTVETVAPEIPSAPNIPVGDQTQAATQPQSDYSAQQQAYQQPNYQQPGWGQQPQPNDGRGRAPNFLGVFRNNMVAASMTPEGTRYVETLRRTLKENSNDVGGQEEFRVSTLTYPPRTVVISKGRDAIALLFSEANHHDENTPLAALTLKVANAAKKQLGSDMVLNNTIVVTPDDYEKVTVMANHVINTLRCITSPEINSLTIGDMNNCSLEVSTSKAVYEDFIRRNNPHGVPARADVSLVITLDDHTDQNRRADNILRQADSSSRTEIAAIGLYTTFVYVTVNGALKFLPEVHISEITTPMGMEGMIPLCLSLAAEFVLQNRLWLAQFSDNSGPNIPNIGNLVQDPATGEPFRVDTLASRDSFVAVNCVQPVLMLDVVEGRARIPGLERYSIPEWYPHIIDSYNRFLRAGGGGLIPIDRNLAPATISYRTYTGTAKSGIQTLDSRWVDFLSVMVHRSSERTELERLLRHYDDERQQVAALRQYAVDLQLLYVNHTVTVLPNVLNAVRAAVTRQVRTVNGQLNTGGYIDMSSVAELGQAYATNPYVSNMYANNYASFQPAYSYQQYVNQPAMQQQFAAAVGVGTNGIFNS